MCMSEKRKPLKPVSDSVCVCVCVYVCVCVCVGAAMHDNHFLYGLYNLKQDSFKTRFSC